MVARREGITMRKAQWALAALIAALALTAQAQVPGRKSVPEFKTDVAKRASLKAKTVDKLLEALGPAMREQLRAGRQVEIDGVGIFRVVRINEYRDLVGGVPGTIPARNYVEFVPATELTAAANSPGAVPARTVDGYQFKVNPNSAPSGRTEVPKVPRSRTTSR
jgi:nucleoid DNA-binding protein